MVWWHNEPIQLWLSIRDTLILLFVTKARARRSKDNRNILFEEQMNNTYCFVSPTLLSKKVNAP